MLRAIHITNVLDFRKSFEITRLRLLHLQTRTLFETEKTVDWEVFYLVEKTEPATKRLVCGVKEYARLCKVKQCYTYLWLHMEDGISIQFSVGINYWSGTHQDK